MRKTLTAIAAAVTIAAAATIGGAGLASAHASPRPCYFDGGGAVSSGSTARTDTGLWTCHDGHLVHVAARVLPSWAHWKTAPRGACGRGIPGIVVWAGHGDGVLICSSGNVETS